MRRLPVDSAFPGLVLARPLYNERGDVLLNAGVELHERYLNLLRARGVSTVLVRETGSDEVDPADIVTERVRSAAQSSIHRVFELAQRAVADKQGKLPADPLRTLRAGGHKRSATDAQLYEQLLRAVESIIEEVLVSDTLPGLGTLKSHDNYTFCHSVDVAVAAILLGKKLFLPRQQLKVLGAGCLLHDIGKAFVPPDLLTKPGSLSDSELASVRQHATLGYEFLRQNMPDDVLPKHIALQHHEHQDGAGYPRGLSGNNKVARDPRERQDPSHMLLLAEIAAVADVYDALASDRPYRAGLPPEKIVWIMHEMRGSQLNAEVLDTFLDVLPHFPVGMDMVVTTGRYEGYRGIVIANNKHAIDRPQVRLLFDHQGDKLWLPVELDLTQEPGTFITCVLEEAPVLA